MELFDLNHQIKVKNVPKFLIFTGNEFAIINLYIEHIQKAFNLQYVSLCNVAQVIQKHKVLSLLGQNNLYVCRYDFDFIKNEKAWSGIDAKLGDNYLVLVYNTLDARSKFYKKYENRIVAFNELSENININMLRSRCSLSVENCELLLHGCGNSYSRCVLELLKISEYAREHNMDEDSAYKLLRSNKVIIESTELKIPEFVNSVMLRKKSCLSFYHKLIANGESNLVLITWLYNACRAQLIYETLQKATPTTTGLPYPIFKECEERSGKYSVDKLTHMLQMCKYCEQGIKNGIIDDAQSIEYLLVMCL